VSVHKPNHESQPFMFDRDAETMPRRNLAALQLRRLKKSLTYACQKVAHIRRKFEAAGVTPDTLGSLADIAHFPFTEKADLRDTYPFGLLAAPPASRPWSATRGPILICGRT